ncbi:polar growth protein [Geranomyces michiganensis]|nr:polar growth protein [Geranomyces michiganensis]
MLVTDPHIQPDFYALDLPFVVYGRHRFLAEEEDEITFAAAEPVVVLERDELYSDGWWRGRNRQGHVGLFPKNFIAFDPPAAPQQQHQQQQQLTRSAIPTPSPPIQQQQPQQHQEKQSEAQDVDHLSASSSSPPQHHHRQSALFVGSPPNVSKELAKLEDRYTLTRAPDAKAPKNLHPKTWDSGAVENWLVKEGFEFALPYFQTKPVSGADLLEFNLSSLRELGMESLSDRINILHQILALKEEFPGEPQANDAEGSSSTRAASTQGTVRGSLHVVSQRGSPAGTSSQDDKDDKDSQAARSQDSGFADPTDGDDLPQTLAYPTRNDSWNHAPLPAPLPAPDSHSSSPSPKERTLRKPASEFTLSDYFYDGAGVADQDDEKDIVVEQEDDDENNFTLPPLDHLQLSSNPPGYGVPASDWRVMEKSDPTMHDDAGRRGNHVGGMVGAPRDDYRFPMPHPSMADLQDQDQNVSPRRQRSLNILNLTRSLTHRNFRKSAPEQPAPPLPTHTSAAALHSGSQNFHNYPPPPPVPQLPWSSSSDTNNNAANRSNSGKGAYRTFPSPDFTGELEFRENEKGAWKKRWCVIDGGHLWVLKSREQPKETFRVPLTPSTQFLPSTSTAAHPYTFCVRTPAPARVVRLQFAAEAQLEMVSWLNALVRAGSHTERTRPVPLIPIRPDAAAAAAAAQAANNNNNIGGDGNNSTATTATTTTTSLAGRRGTAEMTRHAGGKSPGGRNDREERWVTDGPFW